MTFLPLVSSGLAVITFSLDYCHISVPTSEAEGLRETLFWSQLTPVLVTAFLPISFFGSDWVRHGSEVILVQELGNDEPCVMH